MSYSFKAAVFAAGIAGAVSVATPAYAVDTTTFLQFVQNNSNTKMFSYVAASGSTAGATLSTTGSAASAQLAQIASNLPLTGIPMMSTATVKLTATAAANPFVSGSDIKQLFSGSLVFTLVNPVGGRTNALTVTFTNAVLTAAPAGTNAPTFSADSTTFGTDVTYSSAFGDLSDFDARNFSLSFSGASRPLTLRTTGSGAGKFQNFTASGSGTFAGVLPVPEPATWGLMVLGFSFMGHQLRRKKATALTAL